MCLHAGHSNSQQHLPASFQLCFSHGHPKSGALCDDGVLFSSFYLKIRAFAPSLLVLTSLLFRQGVCLSGALLAGHAYLRLLFLCAQENLSDLRKCVASARISLGRRCRSLSWLLRTNSYSLYLGTNSAREAGGLC